MTSLLSATSLIEPNVHVAVVHFPIGLLITGVLAEVVGLVVGSAGLRVGARWMMLLGAMAGVPVSLSGLYALGDVVRRTAGESAVAEGMSQGMTWYDAISASTLNPGYLSALFLHAKIQLGATVVALLTSVAYLAGSDGMRRLLYLPCLLLMLGVAGGVGVGSHVAGQVVYGVVTHVPHTDSLPSSPSPVVPSTHPATRNYDPMPTVQEVEDALAYVTPPLQLHMLLAGSVISLGLVSLACAYRNGSLGGVPVIRGRGAPVSVSRLPASRLLLLTGLLAVAAASAGTWHLARETETRDLHALWEIAVPFPPREALRPEHREELRRPVHIASGVLLVSVPLLLSGYLLLRPRSRFVLTLGFLLFLGASGVQALSGTLLLLDTPEGKLTAPNPASSTETKHPR